MFVAFILGFLIIYASRFLMKRRNKEFGIYMLLGMGKRKISMILFFETILIGIISLAVGLGLGIALSQLMSMLVANMFEADMTRYEFIFSSSACIKTLIYFGIMYVIVMLFNAINVGKCKLIDLIQTSKKSETVKMKNPMLCTIVFIVSAIALGYAYYMVTGGINGTIKTAEDIFKPIIIGGVSTFFIFWSLSGLILKIVMSMKNLYVKGLNTFTLRQVSSKINTTVLFNFDIDAYLKESVEYNSYRMDDFTFGDSLGDSLEYIKNNSTSMIPYNMPEEIYKYIGAKKMPIVLPIALVKIIAPICETYYNIKKEVPLFTKYSLYTLQSKSNFSHEKATKELGYTTRNLNETIEDTIKWFINSNRI